MNFSLQSIYVQHIPYKNHACSWEPMHKIKPTRILWEEKIDTQQHNFVMMLLLHHCYCQFITETRDTTTQTQRKQLKYKQSTCQQKSQCFSKLDMWSKECNPSSVDNFPSRNKTKEIRWLQKRLLKQTTKWFRQTRGKK